MEATRTEELAAAIRALPPGGRLRVVERVVHEMAADLPGVAAPQPPSVIGLFADMPEVVDEVCEAAMEARERAVAVLRGAVQDRPGGWRR